MAGKTVINPGAAVRADVGGGGGGNSSNTLYLNSFRISAAVGRLAMHVGPQPKNDVVEFCQLCLSLARGIDCAIASHDVPSKALELPSLVKQACGRKNDPFTQAAVMVLMISIKSACQSGWFSDKDTEDLCHLANEISISFCSTPDFKCEPSSYQSIISMIISRFFPLLKMGQIFSFLEVKPGYGTFIDDFHISKSVKTSAADKIRLLIAQVDNTETSSCLINPPQANFLLNGKGVEKRTNVSMDTGPQIPTTVSHMLKYGTNLLQAVGEFNGNYIVAVAFMSVMPTPDPATLLDYVQPTPASVDPDSEIIEGPSRISLNCPISFKRIKTPVKGQSCKHLQCFDYHNYIDINSRRPSWRCPHCNQHASFTDIRIDQDMVKVLKEVGENVTNVILSSDGSWKAVMENDDHTDNPPVNKPEFSKDETMLPDTNGISSSSPDIMDLTDIDDGMDVVATGEIEDHRSLQTNGQNQPPTSNPSEVNNQLSHMEDAFWSGVYLSPLESGTSRSSSILQIGGVSEPVPTSFTPSPVLTDALIPASFLQGGDSSPNNLQLLQYQFLNSAITNEYGRMQSIARHAVSRAPIAVQALPAQMPSPVPQQRPRSTMNDVILSVPSVTSQATSVSTNAGSSNVERQHPISRSNSNMVQASQALPPSLPNKQLEHSSNPTRPAQQFVGHNNPIHTPTPYRASSGITAETPLNRNWQGMMNQQTPYTANQSQGVSRSPAPGFSRNNAQGSLQSAVGQAMGVVSGQHLPSLAAQRTAQIARPVQLSRSAPPHLSANLDPSRASVQLETVPVDLASDQDWRPTGRMRGSLSGRAYSDALEQYIVRPTPQAQPQAPRPSSIPPTISPQLQALMANRSVHASPAVNPQSSTPPDVSAGLPQHSSGMQ